MDVERQMVTALHEAHVSFRTTRREAVMAWGRSRALSPHAFMGGCCGAELVGAGGPGLDWAQLGLDVPRYAPHLADLLIVAGTLTRRQAPLLVDVFEKMRAPCFVIALGACACGGGPYDNYATLPGAASVLKVDLFIAGCPPRPEAVLEGLQAMEARIGIERRDQAASIQRVEAHRSVVSSG